MATVGIIGDLHLDLAALEATLTGPLRDCERIVLTGDFLDRGPDEPAEVLDRLLDIDVTLVAGNHELAYLGGPRFPRMLEDRAVTVAPRLRDLVLDGRLVAAHAVGNTLCVHGGVSRAFWQHELEASCGSDATAVATDLNRRFLRGVGQRDFTDPIFAALRDRVRGPFWAHLRNDLLHPGLPPLRQVVGHVKTRRRDWQHDPHGSAGAVFPLEWGTATGDVLGHVVLDASTQA